MLFQFLRKGALSELLTRIFGGWSLSLCGPQNNPHNMHQDEKTDSGS